MKNVLLKDICKLTMGQSPKSEFYRYEQEGLPFMQGCTTFGDFYPTIDTWTVQWNKEAEKDDILFTVRAPVGDINYAPCRMAIGRGLAAIHPIKIEREYLFYLLKYEKAKFLSKSNGSVYDAINIDTLSKMKLCIHEEEERKKISTILNNYDELIENNNKRIKNLEELAEAIYKEWFIRFRFPGFEKETIKDGKPEKWQYKKFSEVCSFVRGLSYSSEQIENPEAPYLLINLKNLRDYGGFRKENFKKYEGDFKEEQTAKKFDLVMAVTEMVQERRIIGYVGLVPSYNQKCVISADLIKIKSKYDNIFLYSNFIFGGASLCFSQYGNGTNVIHLKPTSLRNVKLLIPEQKYIDEYVSIVSKYFDLIDKLQLKNENLIKQRDALLPRLMGGKLSVEGKEIV